MSHCDALEGPTDRYGQYGFPSSLFSIRVLGNREILDIGQCYYNSSHSVVRVHVLQPLTKINPSCLFFRKPMPRLDRLMNGTKQRTRSCTSMDSLLGGSRITSRPTPARYANKRITSATKQGNGGIRQIPDTSLSPDFLLSCHSLRVDA